MANHDRVRSMERRESPRFDAVALGLNIVDVLVRYEGEVRFGEKHEAQQLLVQGGAPAGNAACVMAALGLETGFLGHFGENSLSLVAREEFRRCGVSDELFITSPGARPGVAVVQSDPATGDRTVFFNLTDYHWVTEEDVPPSIGEATRLVLVDGYNPQGAIPLLERAKQQGRKRVLDLEAGDPELLNRMLALATDAILPLGGAQTLTGAERPEDVLTLLSRRTEANVVVTDGPRGSWALHGAKLLHQPAFKVEAVDSTGCGDAFHGGYAFALLKGWEFTLRLEFASYVASRVALALGGRSALPDRTLFEKADLTPLSEPLRENIVRWLSGDT